MSGLVCPCGLSLSGVWNPAGTTGVRGTCGWTKAPLSDLLVLPSLGNPSWTVPYPFSTLSVPVRSQSEAQNRLWSRIAVSPGSPVPILSELRECRDRALPQAQAESLGEPSPAPGHQADGGAIVPEPLPPGLLPRGSPCGVTGRRLCLVGTSTLEPAAESTLSPNLVTSREGPGGAGDRGAPGEGPALSGVGGLQRAPRRLASIPVSRRTPKTPNGLFSGSGMEESSASAPQSDRKRNPKGTGHACRSPGRVKRREERSASGPAPLWPLCHGPCFPTE